MPLHLHFLLTLPTPTALTSIAVVMHRSRVPDEQSLHTEEIAGLSGGGSALGKRHLVQALGRGSGGAAFTAQPVLHLAWQGHASSQRAERPAVVDHGARSEGGSAAGGREGVGCTVGPGGEARHK